MTASFTRRASGQEGLLAASPSGRRLDHILPPPSFSMSSSDLLTPPAPRVSTDFLREGSQSAVIMEDVASPRGQTHGGGGDDDDGLRLGRFHVRLGNGAQRFLSALVLAPLITYFLWSSPAFATTTVCALVVSLSCYEYAWLAHRIHSRFVFALNNFEAGPTSDRRSHSSSTRSSSFRSNGATQPSSGREFEAEPPLHEEKIAASGKRCAVTQLAEKYCYGSTWLAAAAISVVGTAVSTSAFTAVATSTMFAHLTFGDFRLAYSIISSFAAWVCACLTPDWHYATLLIIEKEVFTVLTLYSMKCPINLLRCDTMLQPSLLLLGGVMAITLVRVATTRTPGQLLFHLMLDLLGFVYIIGTLFLIVSFVDLDREATYRKLVIALLYVVWASDSGAYLFGKLLEACHYSHHSHPLAKHLSARKDYEGTCIAIFFGVGAMFLSSYLLHIDGSVGEKLGFAAAAVIVGRIGDLFESLLKRAAMVKDSGTVIPGHGGVLDRIDALMFAAIVFSRYFGAIILPDEQRNA
jgi:CDP-diglyceride synthetase